MYLCNATKDTTLSVNLQALSSADRKILLTGHDAKTHLLGVGLLVFWYNCRSKCRSRSFYKKYAAYNVMQTAYLWDLTGAVYRIRTDDLFLTKDLWRFLKIQQKRRKSPKYGVCTLLHHLNKFKKTALNVVVVS